VAVVVATVLSVTSLAVLGPLPEAQAEDAGTTAPAAPAVARDDTASGYDNVQRPYVSAGPEKPMFDADIAAVSYPNASYVANGVAPVSEAVLVSPADSAVNATTTPTLVGGVSGMNPGAGGSGYEYQYTVCKGTGSCGSSSAVATSTWVKGSWKVPAGVLAANTTYSWTVSARNNPYMGTLFNPQRAFSTGATAPAYASGDYRVELAAPAVQAALTTRTPVLQARLAHATNQTYQYDFTISLCSDAACSSSTAVADSGWIAAASWQVPASALGWGGTYKWTVGARNNPYGGTIFNPYRTFATVVPVSASSRVGVGSDADAVHGVSLYDRHVEERATDAAIPSVGVPLQISRGYSSTAPVDGPFGAGWWSLFSVSLTPTSVGYTVTMADGHQLTFGKNPNGSYAPAPGVGGARLTACTSGCVAVLTDASGVAYEFTSTGLSKVTSAQGFVTTLTRGTDGKVTRVTDMTSTRALTLTWSGAHITSVTQAGAPAGTPATWTYTYSGTALTAVCAPGRLPSCTRYGYTGTTPALLATVTQDGRATRTAVTYQGTAVATVRSGAVTTTFAAAAVTGGQQVTVTSSTGAASTYRLDTAGRTTSLTTRGSQQRWQYDIAGRLTMYRSAAGDLLSLRYDASGTMTERQLWREDGVYATQSYAYVRTAGKAAGKLWMASDPKAFAWWPTTSTPSNALAISEMEYDSAGRVSAVHTGAGAARSTERYTYTAGTEAAVGGGTTPAGLLRQVTDPGGTVTSFEYDATGNLRREQPAGGPATEYTYDWAGRQATVTTIGGTERRTVTTTYDDLGRPAQRTHPVTTDAVTGLQHQRQERWAYDTAGALTATTDADLATDEVRTVTSTYDAAGRLLTRTEADGTVGTRRTYDAAGRLATSTDADGDVLRYTYNTTGDLATTVAVGVTTATDPRPHDVVVESLTYDASGRVATSTDRTGLTRAYRYAFDDQVATTTLRAVPQPDGSTRDVVESDAAYDARGDEVFLALHDGLTRTVTTYDDHRRVTGVRTAVPAVDGVPASVRQVTRTYDPRGLVLTETEGLSGPATRVTTSSYNTLGRLTAQSVASGGTGGAPRVTRFVLDAFGDVVGTVDPRAGEDDLERWTTSYERDAEGRVVRTTSAALDDGTRVTALTGYDAFDQVTGTRSPDGRLTTVSYDPQGRVVAQSAPHAADDPHPRSTSTEYTPGGQVAAQTDVLGQAVTYGYDAFDAVTSVVRPPLQPGADARTWTTARDDAGRATATTDPLGVTTTYTYDALGRTASATTPTATGPATTAYRYDAAGNLTEVRSPSGARTTTTYDAVGEPVTVRDADGVGATTSRDQLGRPVKVVTTDGSTQLVNYDVADAPVAMSVLDAEGHAVQTWAWSYDLAGNQVGEVDPLGLERTRRFDALSRLTSLVQPDGAAATVGYDVAGRPTSYTDALGRTSTATYDLTGQRASLVEPPATPGEPEADRTWTWGHDAAGRVIAQHGPDGRDLMRTYDADGNVVAEQATGPEGTADRAFTFDAVDRLIGYREGDAAQTQAYDALGRLTSTSGASGDAELRYDADGRLVERTDATGTSTYSWTAGGRLATAEVPGLASMAYTYDAGGHLVGQTWAGGTRTLAYDALGVVTSDAATTTDGAVLAAWEYTYDAAGHRTGRTTKTEGDEPATTTYAYDDRGRLASWTDTAEHTITWDAADQATSIDGVARTFDGRGRLLTQGDASFTYDAAGRMTGSAVGGTTSTLTYDAFGRLADDGTGRLGYDALDRLIAEGDRVVAYDDAGTDPVRVGDATYGRSPDGALLSAGASLALTDPHGDLAATVAADGSVQTFAYTPFGVPTAGNADLTLQGDVTSAAGLVHMQARWYDPASATFLSRDDTMLPLDQQNRYAYAGGDPVGYTDPTGRCAIPVPALAGACMGGEGGAAAGSMVMPGPGTVVGAIAGAVAGLVGGAILGEKLWEAGAGLMSWLSGRTVTHAGSSSFDLSFDFDIDLPSGTAWPGTRAPSGAGVGPIRISPIHISPIHIGPIHIDPIHIDPIHIDPIVLDLPTMDLTTVPEPWVSGVMPVGVAAPAAAAVVCGPGGGAACRLAALDAGPACVSAGGPLAGACAPAVSGIWARTPSAAAAGATGAAAATGRAPGAQADCEPGQLLTNLGCEEPLDFLQRKVTEARERLANDRTAYRDRLSPEEHAAAREEPWIEKANHGKAVEREVWDDPEVMEHFTRGGGGGRPDLFARADGAGYEITTTNPSTIAAHLRRAYVELSRLATYVQW
jgi:RHS repeat-associated protein